MKLAKRGRGLRDAAWLLLLTAAGFLFILFDLTVGLEAVVEHALGL